MPTFDLIAGRVRGAIVTKDARVLWDDGTLYIVTSPTEVQALQASQPQRLGGLWRSTLPDGKTVSFIKPGCGSCLRRISTALGGLTLDQIKAAVPVDA